MNTELLINAVVQQTMIFVARLATAGGVRTPLAQVADKVFLELTRELHAQGVTKKVIADMFGMALRTYHRRTKELQESGTQPGRTLWEVTFEFIRERGPVSAARVYDRFKHGSARSARLLREHKLRPYPLKVTSWFGVALAKSFQVAPFPKVNSGTARSTIPRRTVGRASLAKVHRVKRYPSMKPNSPVPMAWL